MIVDTIAAIATAAGRGGIGVVRVSGPQLGLLAKHIVGLVDAGVELKSRHAYYRTFNDAQGQPLDAGLVLYFPAPHSYTGEDVLELQGHGGPVVMQLLLQSVLAQARAVGLQHVRVARAGEFTERAFLNDKLDLAQAEAVADLIDASTEQAARAANRSLRGEFSRTINTLVERLTHLRMLLEATLDFPEEEIDFLQKSDASGQLTKIRATLDEVMAQAKQGELLREGARVVLTGEPNVGKSSLLNALAGEAVAIVTPIAGTTRDKVQHELQLDGVPIHVIDTAGLRESTDVVEKIGIERAWQEIERADVVLHLRDARELLTATHAQSHDVLGHGLSADIKARLRPHVPQLTVFNKIDLLSQDQLERVESLAAQTVAQTVLLSAETHEGIEALRKTLLAVIGWQGNSESLFVARERHLDALRAAAEHLRLAASQVGVEFFAEECRLAQQCLGSITGDLSADDLLGKIFSNFCIGK